MTQFYGQELISVITPVYNLEGYLPRAVESLLEQTYPHWEMVIVDDGSTDGTGTVADRYAGQDSRIRVIHQPNGGVMQARQRGVAEARGAYLFWLDADDYLTPDALERLYGYQQEHDLDLVIGKIYRQGGGYTLGFEDNRIGPCSGEDYLKALLTGQILGGMWGRFYRRSVWENLVYPAYMYKSEDKFLNLQVAKKNIRVGHLDHYVYYYVKRPGSLSYKPTPIEYGLRLIEDIDALFSDRNDLKPYMTILHAQAYMFYVGSSRSKDISREPWVIRLHRELATPECARLFREIFTFRERATIRLNRRRATATIALIYNITARIGRSIRKRLPFKPR